MILAASELEKQTKEPASRSNPPNMTEGRTFNHATPQTGYSSRELLDEEVKLPTTNYTSTKTYPRIELAEAAAEEYFKSVVDGCQETRNQHFGPTQGLTYVYPKKNVLSSGMTVVKKADPHVTAEGVVYTFTVQISPGGWARMVYWE